MVPKKRSNMESGDSAVPTILLDAVAIEEVAPSVWKKVFEAIGYPRGISQRAISHAAILDHVASGEVSEELIEVLQVLHDIGTDNGVDAMKAVATAHNHDLGTIAAMAPRDAAVHLWLQQRADPALHELFIRVQMQAESRREPRAFREYHGKTARALVDWKSTELRLHSLMEAFCKQQNFGDHVEIRGYASEGSARIQVIHTHRLQKPLVVRDGEAGRATIAIRPVHCDIVRYESSSAWLRISPRSTSTGVMERYRRLIGEAFFGDVDFFAPAEYTLRPLQERGQGALDDPSGVVIDARLVEVLWERGDEQKLWLQSTDCFRDAEELDLRLEEGDFVEAKIAVTLIGKRTTRRTITVKVPNKVEFPRDQHEADIEGYLMRIGIQRKSTVAPHRDVWNLHPCHHEPRVWREAYPRDIDPLVKGEVLLPRAMTKIVHPELRGAGRTLAVDARGQFAVSNDEAVRPRQVTASDIDGLELNINRLCETWRSALELDGELRDLGGGLFMLGRRRIECTDCLLAVLTRKPAGIGAGVGLVKRLRDAAGDDRIGLLIPAGRQSGTGLAEIVFERLVIDPGAVWREFVRANKLTSKLSAIWSASENARLVVDRARQLVWLDGVQIEVASDSHPYRLIELLAAAGGAVVTHEAIGGELSGARGDAVAVSKKAKHVLKTAIARSFAAQGKPINVDDIVLGVSGGYRLAVVAYV